MTKLRFEFQEIINEIGAFSGLADRFIAPPSKAILASFKGSLEKYADTPSQGKFIWEIPLSAPLTTTISRGGYEKGDGGEHNVYAEISSIWEIQRIPEKRKRDRATYFELEE